MSELLKVTSLTKKFGGLVANDNVDLTVNQGEIVGLIGPNGAGKTTLFNCLAGYHKTDGGTIVFQGEDITDQPPEKVAYAGIARTFQLVKVFNEMTVLENVMAGAFLRTKKRKDAQEAAMEILDFVGIVAKKDLLAQTLTLPDKKKVEVSRALASGPKLLLLDEAMAGLAGAEISEAVDLISRIAGKGIATLVVEHVMEVVMPISHRVVVLDHGVKIAEDKPEVVANDQCVIEAYLGKSYAAEC